MTTVCIFVPNLNKPILEYQKTEEHEKKTTTNKHHNKDILS